MSKRIQHFFSTVWQWFCDATDGVDEWLPPVGRVMAVCSAILITAFVGFAALDYLLEVVRRVARDWELYLPAVKAVRGLALSVALVRILWFVGTWLKAKAASYEAEPARD